jgi:hypothetical protein
MTRSHSTPMPLILGTNERKLQEWGFDPDSASKPQKSRYLRNICSSGQAPDNERYRGHPADNGIPGEATASMLERLAVHMKYAWPNLFGDTDTSKDNLAIPSGYTYLAQLVAHDLVQNVGPLPDLRQPTDYMARDYRNERLVLDTIYGGGPAAGYLPYELADLAPDQRWMLRLGRVTAREEVNGGPIMEEQPARDIARATCPHLSDSGRRPKGAPEPLIADPRNDDHLILSQLTAMLHAFHNILVGQIRGMKGGTALDEFASYRAFVQARKVAALVYRRIVVNDLLARLLKPPVYEFYKNAQAQDFLDADTGNHVPVEFSHAAYRFGHVMVRFDYALNERFVPGRDEKAPISTILARSSARYPHLMPVACNWLVDWARFFEGLGETPNYSRKIRPDIGKGDALAGDTYFANGQGRAGGIYYRDFVRGVDAGVRSLGSLVDILRAAKRNLSPLLGDANYRENAIGRWLKFQDDALLGGDRRYKFSPDELVALSQDPPLMFFVLFEAAHDEQGKRLGVLGSTILAEVFFAAIAAGKQSIESDTGTVSAAQIIFGAAIPDTMPKLIEFVKAKGGLPPVECAAP